MLVALLFVEEIIKVMEKVFVAERVLLLYLHLHKKLDKVPIRGISGTGTDEALQSPVSSLPVSDHLSFLITKLSVFLCLHTSDSIYEGLT